MFHLGLEGLQVGLKWLQVGLALQHMIKLESRQTGRVDQPFMIA